MRKIRSYNEVQHDTGSELLEQVVALHDRLAERLSSVGTVVAVASGKGGVGRGTVGRTENSFRPNDHGAAAELAEYRRSD